MRNELLFMAAAECIAQADALIIGAGAGMGVDSGLPDFRGNEGFWKAYPALAKAQLEFTEVASPLTFENDPSLAWGFYGHRLGLYRQTVPHAGFSILQNWSRHMKLGARIFTSNVDGQFQKAGFLENKIHECHGSIHHLQCMNDCDSGIWSAAEFMPEVDVEACRLVNSAPHCPRCGGLARPNILMFGDWSWNSERSDAQSRNESLWVDTVVASQSKVVMVEMGAGTAIASVRRFSQRISNACGARLIRINPRESHVSNSKDIGIPMGSLEALQGIDDALNRIRRCK